MNYNEGGVLWQSAFNRRLVVNIFWISHYVSLNLTTAIRKRGRGVVKDHLSIEYEVSGCPVNQFEKQGLKRSGEGGTGGGRAERQFALYSSFLDVSQYIIFIKDYYLGEISPY